MFLMDRLQNKVAIITGGIKGIGLATAQAFVAEGAQVVITDIDGTNHQTVLEALSPSAHFIEHNVADEQAWETVFTKTIELFGHVDIVVNNAGILDFNDAEHITDDIWHKVLAVDLDGVMYGVKHGIAHMKKNGGSIINLSSIAGLIGIPNLFAYNAAKGGVKMLTKSAALYCAENQYQIRINSIHPGYVHTPMVDAYPEMRADLEKLHPLGRLAEASEIAQMAVYLASDESKFVTGSELVIDGGYTAQ
ncbi:3-oxoacyl-ACP reductase [Latilactobacillus fuchuensis DSM 14340 = JCM 11249]|jgi:NAD(P)-dependent dehydrogenase (short-subunit alcohol dehydrogenase family)|uniref:3-oxoacyl-ACP reductase n=2 Tax=Latilactobacillus fuchuensis TaxID=164393 RepID=A0A0R1S4E8_9LACO|nr:3-oxoacyl-ACP reductase [Latilactobacillus fuchuensis DSM 14340 = JCM 11249]